MSYGRTHKGIAVILCLSATESPLRHTPDAFAIAFQYHYCQQIFPPRNLTGNSYFYLANPVCGRDIFPAPLNRMIDEWFSSLYNKKA